MRILFLSPLIPHPMTNGGALRIHHVLRTLLDAGRLVTFAALRRDDESVEGWRLAEQLARPPIVVPRGRSDEILAGLTRRADSLRALSDIASTTGPMAIRASDSRGLWEELAALPLDEFEVVHAETLPMAPYAIALKRRAPHLKTVIDLLDIVSTYKARELKAAKFPWYSPWRFKWAREVRSIRRYERRWLPQFDVVTVCSDSDRAQLSGWCRGNTVRVVINGVDVEYYRSILARSVPPRMLFVGDMGYEPNEQGAIYFADRIFPIIVRQIPEAEFWVVGRHPTPAVVALGGRPGIRVTGAVPDVRPHLESSAVAVVPLLIGGGTRLKILEAMAAGRPVVSTRIGAEGLDAHDGVHLLLSDDPRTFAESCLKLLLDESFRHKLAASGREFVGRHYDWSTTHRQMADCYRNILGNDARGEESLQTVLIPS